MKNKEQNFKEAIDAICGKYEFKLNHFYENEAFIDFSITHIDKMGSKITIERTLQKSKYPLVAMFTDEFTEQFKELLK